MESAQVEFSKVCDFYKKVSSESFRKNDSDQSFQSPIKTFLEIIRSPKKIIEHFSEIILLLENGGLNHLSGLYYQNQMFEFLGKYSTDQLEVLNDVASLNLKSHRSMLYDPSYCKSRSSL